MPQRYDLNEWKQPDLGTELVIEDANPPKSSVSLRGKFFCGLIAGLIVVAASSLTHRGYDAAEAAGAAQVRIAVAEADAQAKAQRPDDELMRGASGMASAKHDWVFDH